MPKTIEGWACDQCGKLLVGSPNEIPVWAGWPDSGEPMEIVSAYCSIQCVRDKYPRAATRTSERLKLRSD